MKGGLAGGKGVVRVFGAVCAGLGAGVGSGGGGAGMGWEGGVRGVVGLRGRVEGTGTTCRQSRRFFKLHRL